MTGEEGGRGVRCGTSVADMTAGMYAAFGIMLALRVKERTGRGQAIDVSMLEGQMSLLGTMIGGYLADGELPEPMGTAYKALFPARPSGPRHAISRWRWAARSSGRSSAPSSGGPSSPMTPAIAGTPTGQRIAPPSSPSSRTCSSTKTYEEWEAIFLPEGIPFGAINNIEQVVNHPQVKARGALVEMNHPRAGNVRMVGAPVRLSETPGSVRHPVADAG